ncbi:TrmB family transcriptional regulator sugar-binding domain-containing protein, partial [Mammaliicoccus vitulinus]|uniref:TrmB family transcriptional regulator sugar-binding domain-containing protein n=1 Tax=Mammaliicoccus vitulinus TaxID=71237 RepID=UPI003F9C569C
PYNVIKNIEGKTNIIEAFNVLISQAEEEVWLSIWDNEIDELQQAAEAQVNKGVQLFSMLFTDVETSSFGKAFYHKETSEVEHNRMEQRLSIVVQDDNEVIIAGFLEGKIPQAIQSHEPMLILLAKEYIRHDMMIKVVDDSIDKQTFDALCSKDKLINYIINNK